MPWNQSISPTPVPTRRWTRAENPSIAPAPCASPEIRPPTFAVNLRARVPIVTAIIAHRPVPLDDLAARQCHQRPAGRLHPFRPLRRLVLFQPGEQVAWQEGVYALLPEQVAAGGTGDYPGPQVVLERAPRLQRVELLPVAKLVGAHLPEHPPRAGVAERER